MNLTRTLQPLIAGPAERMQDWLESFASSDAFMPHGHCYLWKPGLLGLHVISDTLIGLAYFSISLLLYLLVRKVKLPFSPMIVAFGVFIAACGATHVVEVWNVWHGDYWFGGAVKGLTAVASVATAFYLVPFQDKVSALARQAALSEQQRVELERKNAEIEALLSYRRLAEVLPQMVWTAQPDGQRDYYNQRWSEYTGLAPEQTLGWAWKSVLHPDEMEACLARWSAAVKSGEPFEMMLRLRRADGAYRWHLSRAVAVRDMDGNIAKWFGTATDIHDSKLREEEALRVSDFQERLTGIVSHDIRSPTAAILATTGLLLKTPLTGQVRRAMERIDKSAQRIENLILLLLDFTRARLGGGLPVLRKGCDVHEVVRRAVDEARPLTNGQTIEVKQDGSGFGQWDANRLAQLVGNLLENARKYGAPETPIRLYSHGTEHEVVLEVHNSGPPIAFDIRPHLFEPFRRGAQTDATVKLSLGLGLYIVREIARAHGGSVEFASTDGDGTTFRVRLPREAKAERS